MVKSNRETGFQKISEKAKERWASYTEEERQALIEAQRQGMLRAWAAKSAEELREIRKRAWETRRAKAK